MMINNAEDLKSWFLQSGVTAPLQTCVGPLPQSKASLARWTSEGADHQIRSVSPHPNSYRLALLLTPLDARIWTANSPVCGGIVPADRFRLSAPGETVHWSRSSGCDIVNVFMPVDLFEQADASSECHRGHCLSVKAFTQDRLVLDLVHKMLDAKALAGPLAHQACDSLVHFLVLYLRERYAVPMSQSASSGLSGARLRKVLRHVTANLAADVSNAELAALCGISEAHFSREFRRSVGLPPHQYLMKLRLERACIALRQTPATIGDIAFACGFHNASHFSRTFSAHYGVAPAQFRQQHR